MRKLGSGEGKKFAERMLWGHCPAPLIPFIAKGLISPAVGSDGDGQCTAEPFARKGPGLKRAIIPKVMYPFKRTGQCRSINPWPRHHNLGQL